MLDEIRIKNFKCFESNKFQFESLNVLTGINGYGKSSVIQSILLLKQSYEKTNLSGLHLNEGYVKLGSGQDVASSFAKDESPSISFELIFKNNERGFFSFPFMINEDYLPLVKKDFSDNFFQASVFQNSFKYLNTERTSPNTVNRTDDYIVKVQKQLGLRGEFTAHFLSLYGSSIIGNPNLFSEFSQEDRRLNNLAEKWMNEIRPGFKISMLKVNQDSKVVEMKFSFTKDGVESESYRPENVGFGISYSLPVVVSLLSANPGDLLVIENPESHLHPRGQSKIGELMSYVAQSGVQIIVETHSDHILNGIRVAAKEKNIDKDKVRIFYFSESTEKGDFHPKIWIPKLDSEGRLIWSNDLGYNWPDGFFDEWDKNLEKLL